VTKDDQVAGAGGDDRNNTKLIFLSLLLLLLLRLSDAVMHLTDVVVEWREGVKRKVAQDKLQKCFPFI